MESQEQSKQEQTFETATKFVDDFVSEIKKQDKGPRGPIPEVEISREFAGMIYLLGTMAKSNILQGDACIEYIRNFYECDTGKLLRVEQLDKLLDHQFIKDYTERTQENVKKRHDRMSLFIRAKEEKAFESKEEVDTDTTNTPLQD